MGVDVFVKLDRTGSVYQQVYRALRSAILSGRLAACERLPSTRRLAADLKVARNTVLQAFEQLLAERICRIALRFWHIRRCAVT